MGPVVPPSTTLISSPLPAVPVDCEVMTRPMPPPPAGPPILTVAEAALALTACGPLTVGSRTAPAVPPTEAENCCTPVSVLLLIASAMACTLVVPLLLTVIVNVPSA